MEPRVSTQFAYFYELENRATVYKVAVLNRTDGIWVFPNIGKANRFDPGTDFDHISYVMEKFQVSEGDAEGLQMILQKAFKKKK